MRIANLFVPNKTAVYMKQLYPGKEADRRIRMLGKDKAVLFCLILSVSVIISVPVFVMDHDELTKPVTEIDRNEYGEGDRSVTLTAVTEDGHDEKVSVVVKEREYTAKEIERFSMKLDDELWTDILGDNPDSEHIMYDLDLPKHIEGYPFEISWKSDNPLIVESRGTVNSERLRSEDPGDEGLTVRLCATLKYRDHVEDKYGFIILHQRDTNKGSVGDSITEAVEMSDKSSITDTKQILPSDIHGKKISFYAGDPNRGWTVLFLGLAVSCFAVLHKDEKVRSQAAERRKQMDEDHPKIINQYALYYTAGMNPRTIWFAICERYERDRDMNKSGKRYAYEEMILARRMMEEGTEELVAYDRFSERCQTVGFRSFISMIRQTVTKGNSTLDGMLEEEMEKALRNRNNMVKIAASEASFCSRCF